MKKIVYIISILVIVTITGCDKFTPLDAPEITIMELVIPTDASLPAHVKFQITGGEAPYKIWHPFTLDTINENDHIYQVNGISPGIYPHIITVMDAQFLTDTIGITFPVPEITAFGKFKNSDGSIIEIEYKFNNYGTEEGPFYMLSENVYSNIYSFGDEAEVSGEIKIYDGYTSKFYSRYSFEQAFGIPLEDFDDANDSIYHRQNTYTPIIQGICPKYWHLPHNEDWLQLLVNLGVTVDCTPDPQKDGYIECIYLRGDELPKFEKDFNVGYSKAEGTYPVFDNRSEFGIGWWSSSFNAVGGQFVFAIRPGYGFATIHCWSGDGVGLVAERNNTQHVRCAFDFQY